VTVVTVLLAVAKTSSPSSQTDTDEVSQSVQRVPFQRRLFALRRTQNLLSGCIFVGSLTKVLLRYF